MKQPFYKSPQAHKWGLFVCLLGSLGFNLSMNPEHTTIARNSSYNVMDFAQKIYPDEAPKKIEYSLPKVEDTKPVEKTEPDFRAYDKVETKEETKDVKISEKTEESKAEEVTAKVQNISIGANGKAYKVKVTQVGHEVIARFNPITEGKACDNCGETKLITSGSLDDIDKLTEELIKVAPGAVVAESKEKEVAAKPAKPAKKGEAIEADIETYAAKCEGKENITAMECHRTQILKLSADLKNDRDQEKLVTEYFKQYIQRDLTSALNINRSTGEGLGYSEEEESYTAAKDIVQDLVSDLESKNGEKVRQMAIRLRSSSIYQQAESSRNAIVNGFANNDPLMLNSGRKNLFNLRNEATNDQFLMKNALAGIPGISTTESSAYRTAIDGYFNPMKSMFNDVYQKYFAMPTNLQYSKVAIDELAKLNFMEGAITGSPVIDPGTGAAATGLYQARTSSIRSFDGSGLLLTTTPAQQQQQQYGAPQPGVPGGQVPGTPQAQGQATCPYGMVATVSGCQSNAQIPGGYQQQPVNGIPAPQAFLQQRGL